MAGRGQKKGSGKAKVKVGKVKVNNETVKDLTDSDLKKVTGGTRNRRIEIPDSPLKGG